MWVQCLCWWKVLKESWKYYCFVFENRLQNFGVVKSLNLQMIFFNIRSSCLWNGHTVYWWVRAYKWESLVRNAHNLFVLPFVVFCFDVSFILYEFFLNIIQKFPLPYSPLLCVPCTQCTAQCSGTLSQSKQTTEELRGGGQIYHNSQKCQSGQGKINISSNLITLHCIYSDF